ncbi:MAG: transglutaminase family protein [Vicinamibacterales bacterium]
MSADVSPVTYEVVHTTRYTYTSSVSVSHHIARLSPRELPYQECLEHVLQVDPEPSVQATHADYFGNATTFFAMQGAHKGLTVTARSKVSVAPRPLLVPSDTPAWEETSNQAELPLEALDALFDSLSIRATHEFAAYGRPSFPHGRPLMEAVVELTKRIYDDFTFDPEATTVTTSLSDVFRLRRGVCQDFARFEIACLRSLGLPAHYVSGYLETVPPPGKPRRVGADASHAWLAVYCAGVGWIDVDPTNNMLPSTGHVTLGWGRDYGDVSPIHGVILGGGGHSLQVNVDVIRV